MRKCVDVDMYSEFSFEQSPEINRVFKFLVSS